MWDIFGILLMFMGAVPGLLFQDPAVCRFTESNQCYVGLGRRLHLQMPLDDEFELKINKASSSSIIKYRKHQSNNPPKPARPRWQFVHDNKTMILTSAERIDSGTYTLELTKADGTIKGSYNLQLYTEAMVSSVKVSDNCWFPTVRKVHCSANGDNLHFNWTSESTAWVANGNRTFVLDKTHNGKVTCHVKNNVSCNINSIELHTCPSLILPILGAVGGLLIVLSVLAFYIFKKNQGLRNKEGTPKQQVSHSCGGRKMQDKMAKNPHGKKQATAPAQDSNELVYADVTHLPTSRTETRSSTYPAQDEIIEYTTVATTPSQRNQKRRNDEVQYGELVFNTPGPKKSDIPKVQEESVYSEVQHRH